MRSLGVVEQHETTDASSEILLGFILGTIAFFLLLNAEERFTDRIIIGCRAARKGLDHAFFLQMITKRSGDIVGALIGMGDECIIRFACAIGIVERPLCERRVFFIRNMKSDFF